MTTDEELERQFNSVINPDGSRGFQSYESQKETEDGPKSVSEKNPVSKPRKKRGAKKEAASETTFHTAFRLRAETRNKLNLLVNASVYAGSDEKVTDILDEALSLLIRKRKEQILAYFEHEDEIRSSLL